MLCLTSATETTSQAQELVQVYRRICISQIWLRVDDLLTKAVCCRQKWYFTLMLQSLERIGYCLPSQHPREPGVFSIPSRLILSHYAMIA